MKKKTETQSIPEAQQAEGGVMVANEVELGRSRERIITNLDDYIANVLAPKHKDKQIVWQRKDIIREKFRGWTALKIDFDKEDVVETDNFDESERAMGKNLTLAWRSMERFHVEQKELAAKNKRVNQFVNQEGTATQARELNRSLGSKDVYAKPLEAQD